MKQIETITTTAVITFLITAIVVFLFGNRYDGKTAKEFSDELSLCKAEKLLNENNIDYDTKVDNCIKTAELEYSSFFQLNSEPNEDAGDGVRRWNSKEHQEFAEQKLRNDKEFCLERYK